MSTTNIASSNNNWYTNAYSGPFRANRLRAPSLVPHSRPIISLQQTLVVDAARQGHGATTGAADGGKEDKNIRRRETIFGPDVGEDDEPGWTGKGEGVKVGVDVVKGWVEKAKSEDGLHATTTLQALVNLKRPSLQLQQLEQEVPYSAPATLQEGEIAPASTPRPGSMLHGQPLHLLKFNYDATTPRVKITLSIHPTPIHVEGKEAFEEDPKIVYSGVHDGGFNQPFNLPASSGLDLSSAVAPANAELNVSALNLEQNEKNEANVQTNMRDSQSVDTNRSSIERSMGNLQVAPSTQPDLATVPEVAGSQTEEPVDRRAPRRFGIFPRRGAQERDPEAGEIEMINRNNAAAAAVDAEAAKAGEEKQKEPERGLRLLIRIEAVGTDGEPHRRRNAQLTHILINGMVVPDNSSTVPVGQGGKRVWLVKVVRREAIIGAHTFLLKEIYGLSSTQSNAQTSYPPGEADPYASTPNECIVCLTSPRDVVLLPCRHLVVCRDCAVGMVEFGAGGKVARRDGEPATAADDIAPGAAGATGAASATPAPAVAGGTTERGRERRKKKAKGWYCPVCRQPYTSLLRLALPASVKPTTASRAPSIRSVRSTHTLRRVPSLAPTLPDGAERMLDSLRPNRGEDEEEEEEDHVEIEPVAHEHRPQFVLGPEVDDEDVQGKAEKAEVEHREDHSGAGRASSEGKGWKEVQ